jgi:hypothetical protein
MYTIDNAIAQTHHLFGQARREASAGIRLVQEAARIGGSESVFRRIEKAQSVDDFLDCAAELRYALIFEGLRFKVEFLPPGAEARPDLLVSRRGASACVEVKRIRPDCRLLPPSLTGPGTLPQYGGPEDVRKIEADLREKFRQVRAGSDSIIAIWSHRDLVEEVDFRTAVENIRRSPTDPADGRFVPNSLLLCIYGGCWVNCATGQQLHCYPVRARTEPFITWGEELDQVRIAF